MEETKVTGVTEIAPGVWTIECGGVRAFVLQGAERALLIDTAFGGGEFARAVSELVTKPLTVALTHADPDHAGGVGLYAEVYLHPSEFGVLAGGNAGAVTVRPLWEGDVIDLGGRRLEVVLTPGHTPGSVAFLDRENRFLISGDPIQTGIVFMMGPERNIDAYIASMEKLIAMGDAFDVIYPSHSELTVKPDLLPKLVEAAKLLKSGKVEGGDPPFPMPCKLYDCGAVRFMYDKL